MKHLFPIYGMCSILWLGACTPVATQPEKSLFTTQEDFPNLLNVKNVPEQPVDGDLNLFSDLGAWSGYALPVNQSRAFAGAFIGPMTMHGRGWIAQTLAQPTLVVNGESTTWSVICRQPSIYLESWYNILKMRGWNSLLSCVLPLHALLLYVLLLQILVTHL